MNKYGFDVLRGFTSRSSLKGTLMLRRFLVDAVKLFIGFVIFSPLLYAIIISIMPPADIAVYPPKFIPSYITFEYYKDVMNSFPVFRYIFNTLVSCIVVIFAQILTSCFAAYAFVFFKFKGREFLFAVILVTMMIPGDTIIIANFLTICSLKLNDTYLALVLPYLVAGMGVFLMRQSFMTVPKELKEAADIDGCGQMRFLFKILMPISIPSIVALSINTFIGTYNHYLWPLLVTNTANMRTVQIGMSILTTGEAGKIGDLLAGAVIFLIIPALIFVIGHKYLVKGLTAGAVKG